MHHRFLIAGLLALAPIMSSHAQPAQPTLQQQFESASDALAEARWEEALARFQALEDRLQGGNPRSLAIVRVRKAAALAGLQRRDEAAEALRLGLPDLPADDASLAEDRFLGLRTLGELAELSLDYAEARRHFEAARAVDVEPRLKLTLYRGLIQTQMFADPETALARADEALALAERAEADRDARGLLRTFRGRVLLNLGRHGEARSELQGAMRLLGGLTTSRINLSDIVSRSDLAIAALLAGDPDDARRYLAYSGAGRFETQLSPARGSLRLPSCGDAIRPDDVAVVEYSILDNGTVGRASPIYASRRGDVAIEFARAVLDWAWEPESFGEMPPLLRRAMRVELRCARPDGNDDSGPDDQEIRLWAAAQGVDWPADGRFAQRPPAQIRGDLAREEGSPNPNRAKLLTTLVELARHGGIGRSETLDLLRRALPLAVSEEAPPPLTTSIVRRLLELEQDSNDRSALDFARFLALPHVAEDPRMLASLRVAQASSYYQAGNEERAAQFVELALATPGLGDTDDIRRNALQLKAALAAQRGNLDEAQAAFAGAGARAEPCRYLPRTRTRGASSSRFPQEALRWGFEGWASAEVFILPDGRPTSPRTVRAYPPFVFGQAAERLALSQSFDRYFTPRTEGCPYMVTVHFRIGS